jgi:hypothetical protein
MENSMRRLNKRRRDKMTRHIQEQTATVEWISSIKGAMLNILLKYTKPIDVVYNCIYIVAVP